MVNVPEYSDVDCFYHLTFRRIGFLRVWFLHHFRLSSKLLCTTKPFLALGLPSTFSSAVYLPGFSLNCVIPNALSRSPESSVQEYPATRSPSLLNTNSRTLPKAPSYGLIIFISTLRARGSQTIPCIAYLSLPPKFLLCMPFIL